HDLKTCDEIIRLDGENNGDHNKRERDNKANPPQETDLTLHRLTMNPNVRFFIMILKISGAVQKDPMQANEERSREPHWRCGGTVSDESCDAGASFSTALSHCGAG